MDNKKILVTGGAGYIGSHIVKHLLKSGYRVLVIDNLSAGFSDAIDLIKSKYGDIDFLQLDLADKEKVNEVFKKNQIDAVIHLAAKIFVDESVKKPELYHQENYLNSVNVLNAMTNSGVKNIIFSSTAAVYGDPKYVPVGEKHPTNPLSPYAQTKLDFERYLEKTTNLNFIVFRFFNVAGSDLEGFLGKSHTKSNDLIENIMKVALHQKEHIKIYGNNFSTPDKSPIRDFIHVEDVARAHVLGLRKILNPLESVREIFNLGTDSGFSVREVIDKATTVIGEEIPTVLEAPREGDLGISIADNNKAKIQLGWKPEVVDLGKIIESDWLWRKDHPMGYIK